MDVNASQEFLCGTGVAQTEQRAVLPLRVLQQPTVTDKSFESSVQAHRLVASADAEQQVRHTS